MFFDRERNELRDIVQQLKVEIAQLKIERDARKTELDLTDEAIKLKNQIETLKIEKDRIKEGQDRRERELTHMIGLEKQRQEVEIEQARKESMLIVREENLTSQQQAFETHMKFQQERFEKEVGYLKELMGEILERLPTITVDRTIRDRKTDQ